MKFLPVKEGNAAILMRLPVRRLSLKVYIENTMIPDIIGIRRKKTRYVAKVQIDEQDNRK